MTTDMFQRIASEFDLGTLLCEPTRVYGGLLHISYKLTTEKGVYMVKLFGKPKDKKALDRFRKVDELEEVFKKNKVKAIYCLRFNGSGFQVLDGEVFYIFPWQEGWKSIHGVDSTKSQCKKIAKLTAQIHSIDMYKSEPDYRPLNIDWRYYLDLAKKSKSEIYKEFKDSIEMLEELCEKAKIYGPQIPSVKAVAHNDMDGKNVLWKGRHYRLIDLECLCYTNPYMEVYRNALNWAGYEQSQIDIEKYKVFLKTYFRHVKLDKNVDFNALYYGSAIGYEWLEFSLKRALKLVGDDKEEQDLGVAQTKLTISQIRHFYEQKDNILSAFER